MAEQDATASASANVSFSLLENSRSEAFQQQFPSYSEGLVRGEPGGFVLTQRYANKADHYVNFPLKDDDVWVVTFPKCGTTWTQEMVWMVTHDCDSEAGKKQLHDRSPFIEWPTLTQGMTDEMEAQQRSDLGVEALESPRVIKSHLPLYLLPPQLVDTCKVVYVARNPKDVMVSYYHHHRLIDMHEYRGTVEEFADYFMNDEVYYAPFFPHILEGWAKKDHPNFLFLFYEDMKSNLQGEIDKVCKFLGKTLSEEQRNRLLSHLKFDNFSKNSAVNNEYLSPDKKKGSFVRKGKTGDWKNHFSGETNDRIDEWIRKNLQSTDLKFKMELEHQD